MFDCNVLVAALVVAAISTLVESGDPLIIDRNFTGQALGAIGGLSGGGATSRLLVDYQEPQRSEILDYLFVPNFGASLQLLKVEIGGDSQSTDGTESSHMHSEDDLDYNRGYEWWLMQEAKKRNPNIKLYGLPWAFPGWVGKESGSPFSYPNQTASYIAKWVEGAKTQYNLDIDYIGIWNERSSDATYVKTLRKTLDAAGFGKTEIVAKDGDSSICDDLAKDKDYADAVSVIGLHYPSDFSNYDNCYALNKPIWASEESSSYDDLNGAACWGRVITSHWVLAKFTASIMWNLVGSYYHGTNWYASSMMTAVEPWSGNYWVSPVVWATAHITQFTEIGWLYLQNGHGSGQLPNGGYYVTLVDKEGGDFTMNIVKIDLDHAPCTRPGLPSFDVSSETVTFQLSKSMGSAKQLALWHSDLQNATNGVFERWNDIQVADDGTFSLHIPVGAMFTVSTIMQGPQKGSHGVPPASVPQFPLPYSNDFSEVAESQEGKYFADQIGAFEVHADESGNKRMVQMVPELPIGWSDHGSRGPMTLIGMREWQDLYSSVKFRISSNVTYAQAAGCIANRVDQMWDDGITFCVYLNGTWTLSNGGPSQSNGNPTDVILQGNLATALKKNVWYTISLTTVTTNATGMLDSTTVFAQIPIRDIDTGFSVIGTTSWIPVEFDDFSISEAGAWVKPSAQCNNPKPGAGLAARPCARNGFSVSDMSFTLRSDWGLVHDQSGLCIQAQSSASGVSVSLQVCDASNPLQQFKNDYTRIRNTLTWVYLDNTTFNLVGEKSGVVRMGQHDGDWDQWVYFPNTHQLRNQYTANTSLGYPMCLVVTC
eukprot:m.3499 g.3499  ORF g.3499 m.3499 type:complete len:823 (+) comp2079_c0_seq1:3832-6300(+)